jgi:undecaprenyl-diphosphatase
MTIVESIILGIIEGITEFLPISSTGHLILAADLLHISDSPFVSSFEIIIQLGAILAVVFLYWRALLQIENIKKLIVAFIPTGIIGLTVYKIIKQYLLGNAYVVVGALFLGGIVLIVFELLHKENDEASEAESGISDVTYKQALGIGLFQSLAVVPGVSRSAATIMGGLLLGLKRKTTVEFSFLLAVPTMCAATGLDLLKNAGSFSRDQAGVLAVGFIVSFVVALLSIKFLLVYIQKHNFIPFGVYRIILALLFWIFILN